MINVLFEIKKPIIVFTIAIIMGVLFLIFKTPPIRRDSAGYHRQGIEVSENNFKVINSPEPGYLIFLGICFKVFARNDNAARLIQVLLSGLTALLVYYLAKRYYGEKIGFISGLLYSLCPTFAHYPGFFLRETLIVFLFLLSYYLIIISMENERISLSIACAFSIFFLILTKNVFLLFGLFAVPLLIIFVKQRIDRNRRLVINSSIIVLLPLIFYFTWIYMPKHKDDSYRQNKLGNMIGGTLIFNAAALTLSPKEHTSRLIGLISRNLSEKIFPEIDFNKCWPFIKYDYLYVEAARKYPNLVGGGEDKLRLAIDLYKEHPFGYFVDRIANLIRLNAFQYPSRLNETDRWKDFYNRSNSKLWVVIIADIILKFLSNPFIWFMGGVIVMKKTRLSISPVLLPVLYINLIHCFLYGIPRYALPALPIYLISGAVIFYYFIRKIEIRYPSLHRITYIFTAG